jgi:hypothetical protein
MQKGIIKQMESDPVLFTKEPQGFVPLPTERGVIPIHEQRLEPDFIPKILQATFWSPFEEMESASDFPDIRFQTHKGISHERERSLAQIGIVFQLAWIQEKTGENPS